MTWIRPTTALAALALTAHLACTTDDVGSSADSGSQNDSGNTNPTSADDTADSSSADDGSVDLGCAAGAVGDTTDGATDPLMETWGAPCSTDQDCITLLGDDAAICDLEAVVYELPGGYCTKACELPDEMTQSVLDAADCDPAGGVACVGVKGTFERCIKTCTDDQQCERDGFICRQLPLIALPEDPRMCLMPDCCLDGCAEM